ncbi:MAG: thioredoxin family protein, partial [Pseudomonadota bacterium]
LLDTPICDFGKLASAFSLYDFDGRKHQMRAGEKGLLIAFICNHCPYVKAIIDDFVSDADQLIGEGVRVFALMPNDYQNYRDDSPEKMKEFAKRHKMTFPYLVDETQKVAKAYGAVCTPDFFGYNQNLELQYRGRLNDKNPSRTQDHHQNSELLNAMRQIIKTGHGPQTQHPSMGCSIKWRD